MKQLLLLTAVSLFASASIAHAEAPAAPQHELENSFVYTLSPDGNYAVSQSYFAIKVFNLATNQVDEIADEDGMLTYTVGIGKCISNSGVLVGGTNLNGAMYWIGGEWYDLPLPEFNTGTNLANAITPDAKRICGSIGTAEISLDSDALMQVPCIWNADGEGYADPIMLPHPDRDFTGRVPQYVSAVDISEDGKTVIGQVVNATGMMSYPIIYKENADGTWTYEIVHESLLNPAGLTFPEYPGDGPDCPNQEQYMTQDEIAAYNQAVDECVASGFTIPYPDYADYMTPEEKAAYDAAYAEYMTAYETWETAFYAWFDIFDECLAVAPGYEFNSVRISPDGKNYASTIGLEDPNNPFVRGYSIFHVWVFDTDSDNITKYDQLDDLHLLYLANDATALASTSVGTASNSFVLSAGKTEKMIDWMTLKAPTYANWMNENMVYAYDTYEYDPETGNSITIETEELMTGRAVSTPDLSVMALTVQNIWDFMTDGECYIFDMTVPGLGVNGIEESSKDSKIFDISGRQLKNASEKGIYIIDGKKKVVF